MRPLRSVRSAAGILALGVLALGGCLLDEHGESPPDAHIPSERPPLVTSDFFVTLEPSTITFTAPGSAVVTVKIARTGPRSQVTLQPSHVTAGIVVGLAPLQVPGNVDTAQLTITEDAPLSGSVQIDATGNVQHGEAVGTVTRSVTLSVTAN